MSGCGYDPEMMGAKCQQCYLYRHRDGIPVPPELNVGSKIAVIAEAPGGDEVKQGRPLIGRSGMETMSALGALGFNRSHVSWSNAILCRPPNNDLDRLRNRMKKENQQRVAEGLQPWLDPVEACRPRLVGELRTFKDVIAMGKVSFTAITGVSRSIFDIRGMPSSGNIDGKGQYHPYQYFAQSPQELVTPLRIVPTLHPAFVLRQNRWRHIFRNDMGRAIRWFMGALKWQEPKVTYIPTMQQIHDFLIKRREPFFLVDLETDAKECLVAKIRCVGVGTPEEVIVVPFLGIDGYTRFYNGAEEEEIVKMHESFFTDPTKLKAGHNFGYYDRIVIERQLGVSPLPYIDTILYHRGAESEMPHNLGYVGGRYTDVMEAWKADHTAVTAKTDMELWTYNATDVVVNARCVPPLHQAVEFKQLTRAISVHHEIQGVCAGMHTNGMYVDQVRRKWHDEDLRVKAAKARHQLRTIIDDPNFNPNSRDQVAAILFDKWGLTPDVIYENDPSAAKKIKHAFTTGGSPSTGDDHLRAMMLYTRDTEQKAFLRAMRNFRGAVKLRGTNIIPLRPIDEPYWETDDLAIDLDSEEGAKMVDEYDPTKFHDNDSAGKSVRKKTIKEKKKKGLVLSDNRVHPHYNAHAASTQRLSSSEPNGQNWSRKIRDIVCAHTDELMVDGKYPSKFRRALLAADMDQLELRFGMALANEGRYLEVFAKGLDPHAVTCELLYGAAFKNGSESDRKRMRDFGKRFSYAVLYKAQPETVHETLVSSETDSGELVFPDLTLKETRVLRDRWLKGAPGIEAWWDKDLTEYREKKFLTEPVLGWRCDFMDGEDENMIANFKCQAGGSAIVHVATVEFLKHVPFARWGPGTGIIQQGHDALMVEVPAEHAPVEPKRNKDTGAIEYDKFGNPKIGAWCAKGCKCITNQMKQLLKECMTVDGRPYGLPVTFTADSKVGFRWSDV